MPTLTKIAMALIGLGNVNVIRENWLDTGPDILGDFHKNEDDIVNFLDFAFPQLAHYGLHATVFVPSGKVGHYNDWDERAADFIKMPIMSYQHLRQLPPDRVEIGSHGISHSRLDQLATNVKI